MTGYLYRGDPALEELNAAIMAARRPNLPRGIHAKRPGGQPGVVKGGQPGRPRGEIRHGTYAGFMAHQRAGEEPCGPCREASRAQQRAYRARKARR